MSSERRSEHGDLPDGVAPPTDGGSYNPNPQDQVAANRARFEEAQRKLQHERQEAADAIRNVQHRVEEQYEHAQHDPEHQRFVTDQIAHQTTDPPHIRGGQEQRGDPESLAAMPANVEIGRHAPKPTTPRHAEEFNNEE